MWQRVLWLLGPGSAQQRQERCSLTRTRPPPYALSVSRVHAYAIAGFGLVCSDSASTISAANTQSAPAMKNAGR